MKAWSGKFLVLGFALLTAGVFVLTLTWSSSVGEDGGVQVGVKRAAACSDQAERGCLPALSARDLGGRVWNRETLAGKVVLVNFWATWCQPCIAELPSIEAVYRKHKDQGLVVLGLLTDTPTDQQLDEMRARYVLSYTIVRVDS
jgi:thiol-disulfide isomerase/thioredoxin